jgi:hypothetical protein
MINQTLNQEALMADTFSEVGNDSYSNPVDDYSEQSIDYDLKGPNVLLVPQIVNPNSSF